MIYSIIYDFFLTLNITPKSNSQTKSLHSLHGDIRFDISPNENLDLCAGTLLNIISGTLVFKQNYQTWLFNITLLYTHICY